MSCEDNMTCWDESAICCIFNKEFPLLRLQRKQLNAFLAGPMREASK